MCIRDSSRVEGEILEYHGKILKHGGHKKPKAKVQDNQTPSPMKSTSTMTTFSTISPVKKQKLEKGHEPPPSTSPHLDNFYPVWSSTDGHWTPYFWIGPCRNIVPSRRSQPHSSVVERLFLLQNNKCRLCSCQVSRGVYSNSDIDHIIPLNLGGLSTESNLQIICVPCHRRKTALESRKLCRRMTEPDVNLENHVVYAVNSHVFFTPESVKPLDPKGCLEAKPGVYKLFY